MEALLAMGCELCLPATGPLTEQVPATLPLEPLAEVPLLCRWAAGGLLLPGRPLPERPLPLERLERPLEPLAHPEHLEAGVVVEALLHCWLCW